MSIKTLFYKLIHKQYLILYRHSLRLSYKKTYAYTILIGQVICCTGIVLLLSISIFYTKNSTSFDIPYTPLPADEQNNLNVIKNSVFKPAVKADQNTPVIRIKQIYRLANKSILLKDIGVDYQIIKTPLDFPNQLRSFHAENALYQKGHSLKLNNIVADFANGARLTSKEGFWQPKEDSSGKTDITSTINDSFNWKILLKNQVKLENKQKKSFETISSDQVMLHQHENHIRFENNVLIKHQNWQATADKMHFFSEKKIFDMEEKVKLSYQNVTISGNIGHYDGKNQKMTICEDAVLIRRQEQKKQIVKAFCIEIDTETFSVRFSQKPLIVSNQRT